MAAVFVPAMKEECRQLVLLYCGGELAGYFQYAVHGTVLMMEEIQIQPEYQGSGLFRRMYLWLEHQLPAGLLDAEAYSHKSNRKSQAVLEHLGLERIGENPNGTSWRYRGPLRMLWERLGKDSA